MRYEYSCQACRYTYELDCKIEDRDVELANMCSMCGAPLSRSVGSGNFILKGNCWAKDGYSSTLGDIEKFESK